MSLRTISVRSFTVAALFAVVLAGCPTGPDPEIADVDAGAVEGGPVGVDGSMGDGGGGTNDAADAADAFVPPPCGRLTTPCAAGGKCVGSADCASKVCFGGTCQVAAPADGVKNGDETDIDCGGSKAPACVDGKACLAKADCTSGVCTLNVCQVPSPTDMVQNGDETGVDCGGTKAPKCPAGSGCLTTADCNQVKCDTVQKKCLAASHGDGIKNDGETGVDCGGTAPTKCPTGQGCVVTGDCDLALCDVGGTNVCLAPTHGDGIKNDGETGTDCGGAAPTKCPTGQGCVATSDCDLALCDVGGTNVCLAPTHADGIKNLGETGIDCGGAALPALKCPPGQGCTGDGDCNNVRCNLGTLVCDPPSATDGLQNGTETDVDCGGAAPTKRCAAALKCGADSDCASTFCNTLSKVCVEALSCKTTHHGADTCGPAGNESCCKSAVAGGVNLDKFNITAGRFRQFVEFLAPAGVGGDMRTWLTTHLPAGWPANWTAMLPTQLDNGASNPDFTGIYQELGPDVHPPAAVGANEGCFIDNFGARTYRIPDAVNTRMGDPQYYTQAFLDDRALNCVTIPMLAAFCAWDGGKLATKEQIDAAWGAGTYPWGNSGSPLGYEFAWASDPMGLGASGAYGPFQGSPFPAPPLSATDLGWANYNFNYWGGASRADFGAKEDFKGTPCTTLEGAPGLCPWRDYSIYVAAPGRFPSGNSTTGHADLAGNVFNGTFPKQPNVTDTSGAADDTAAADGTNAHWSRSGSWQGHTIPWTAKKSWLEVPASYKYWAMGGRCTR